jgi:Tol biopolymer transport system component
VKLLSRYYIWGYNLQTGQLTQYNEGLTPSPLPDGKRLLITRLNKETANGEIWLIDIEKGSETLIISDKLRGYSSPQISPDGKSLLCVGTTVRSNDKPMNLDIYKLNLDGTGLTQLTFHPAADVSPRWGADGKSVYFISGRGSSKLWYNLWKMDLK